LSPFRDGFERPKKQTKLLLMSAVMMSHPLMMMMMIHPKKVKMTKWQTERGSFYFVAVSVQAQTTRTVDKEQLPQEEEEHPAVS
jgi:hypothetical protein